MSKRMKSRLIFKGGPKKGHANVSRNPNKNREVVLYHHFVAGDNSSLKWTRTSGFTNHLANHDVRQQIT